MSKDEIINQVLTEQNNDLYLFWAKKLLTEYPEYQEKVLNNWYISISNVEGLFIYDNCLCSNVIRNSKFTNSIFYYTSPNNEAEDNLYNVLQKEVINKQKNKQNK